MCVQLKHHVYSNKCLCTCLKLVQDLLLPPPSLSSPFQSTGLLICSCVLLYVRFKWAIRQLDCLPLCWCEHDVVRDVLRALACIFKQHSSYILFNNLMMIVYLSIVWQWTKKNPIAYEYCCVRIVFLLAKMLIL